MKDYSGTDFNSIVARLYPTRATLFSQAPVKVVGIRGADDAAGGANSFAAYDDQFLVFLNQTFSGTWKASTDPTWYFVQNPIVRDSTGSLRSGQLCPGVHLFGRHVLHGKYPCFGQAEEVHLYRLKTDGSVDHIEYGDFAVCIHSGGAGMSTGRFSLACQILHNDDGYFGNPIWNKFYVPIRDALSKSGLETFPYLLLNASDLTAPAPAPVTLPPVTSPVALPVGSAPPPATNSPIVIAVARAVLDLLSNTLGGDPALAAVVNGSRAGIARAVPAVHTPGIDRVQDALSQLNYAIDLGPGRINRGYFGPLTEAKLIAFQRAVPGLTPDGVVTRETLFALDEALLTKGEGLSSPRPAPLPDPPCLVIPLPRLDGYAPPPASRRFLENIAFNSANAVGKSYLHKFAIADHTRYPRDPSRCQTLFRFPDGTIYFDSKMAVDTDGSPNAKVIDPNPDDASTQTSFTYPGTRIPFDAEKIPYIALPEFDKVDRLDFLKDMGLELGNLVIAIYRDKIAGALFVDEGPTDKIGEGSVRLHEMLGVNPWDRRHTKIIDSSISDSVLFFVFPKAVGDDLTPDNAAEEIQRRAAACFEELGGVMS